MSFWITCERCGERFMSSRARKYRGQDYCSVRCVDAARQSWKEEDSTIADGLFNPKVSNSAVARKHEQGFAKEVGGRRVPGSGCGANLAGDVEDDEWLYELKTTRSDSALQQRRSFRLTTDLLDKALRDAHSMGKKMAMVIRIEGHEVVVVQKQNWLDLIGAGDG